MKRVLMLITVLIAACCCMAETRPDGSTSMKYGVSFDRSLLDGWVTMEYVESEGLLLSACTDFAEITVSIENGFTAQDHLESAARYADIISSEITEGYLSYSYTLKRGRDTETVYSVDMYIQKLDGSEWENIYLAEDDEPVLAVTMTSWGGEYRSMFTDGFAPSVLPVRVQVSESYLALLTGCTETDGKVYVSLDFVVMDYDSIFENVIFLNEDDTLISYELAGGALVYLPDMKSEVYALVKSGADAETITDSINGFKDLYGQNGLYIVAFDANNRIIRMQHYNVL